MFSKFVVMEPTFIKIATYQYSSEAMITKGRLEADGIEVYMADNLTIDTDPMVSNAIGGVKLFVKTEDAAKAKEVLISISRYAVDNEGNTLVCPGCGNHKVEVMSTVREGKSLMAFIVSALFVMFPFYTKYKYHCNSCGHEFEIK